MDDARFTEVFTDAESMLHEKSAGETLSAWINRSNA